MSAFSSLEDLRDFADKTWGRDHSITEAGEFKVGDEVVAAGVKKCEPATIRGFVPASLTTLKKFPGAIMTRRDGYSYMREIEFLRRVR